MTGLLLGLCDVCFGFFPGIEPNFQITRLMTLSLYFENKETKRERVMSSTDK